MNDLAALRNLGPASAQRLEAAGCRDAADLARDGAAAMYVRVWRHEGRRPSRLLLWALFGALVDLDWRELPPEERDGLLRDVEALAARP